MDLELADNSQKLYICPGETIPISYSVHLARLARMYPACQDCPLSCEGGANALAISRKLAEQRERQRGELSRSLGSIRGVYLNQITRRVATDVVSQFAQSLWERTHRSVRTHRREQVEQWTAPTVVIGYDQRPSSPDIVTGIQDGLRVMGCDVIDLGLTSGPELQFGIVRNKATSGVLVTGAGCTASWTGFDFYDQNGLSVDVSSVDVPRPCDQPRRHSRPVRISGQHRFKPVSDEFADRIQRQLRPNRRMRVVVGVEDQNTRDHFQRVLSRLAADDIRFITLPKRVRDVSDPEDPDTRTVAESVLGETADVGFVVDEDNRHFAAIDEEGELLPAMQVARFLDPAALPVTATITSAAKVLYGTGHLVFRSQTVQCAASLTLVHLITALARKSAPASELVG